MDFFQIQVVIIYLFTSAEILEYYHSNELKFPSGRLIHFDIFLPKELIGFEYQPKLHVAARYKCKKLVCQQHGITLIQIPYWWDFQTENLLGTIYTERQDLILRKG